MSLKKASKIPLFRSIGARLALGYGLVLFASVFIIAGLIYALIGRDLVRRTREVLASEMTSAVSDIEREMGNRSAVSELMSRRTVLTESPYRMEYALFDAEGLLLAKSEGFPEDPRALERLKGEAAGGKRPARVLSEVRQGRRGRYFIATQVITDRTGEFSFLQLGMSDDSIRKTLGVVLQGMMLAVPAVLALAFLGGFFLTRRILAPLRRLGAAAEVMSGGDLRRELPVSGTGDELDRLAGTFNAIFKRLHEAHDRILRFTADASHELRLPLAAIRGEAEVILSRERSIEEYREALARILEEFERLSRLIEHLLELTRSDSGAETVIRENVHLGRLLEDLVEFYRPLAGEKGIRLFSKGDRDAEMPGDPARLKQLFSNLLDNAVKFTSSGGEVTVELEDRDREIEVRISDTGIGIAREEHHRIFERFYRADRSRARTGGGTGLGLSIAETIAKAHGGRIAVESSPGRGSTFTVTFSMV